MFFICNCDENTWMSFCNLCCKSINILILVYYYYLVYFSHGVLSSCGLWTLPVYQYAIYRRRYAICCRLCQTPLIVTTCVRSLTNHFIVMLTMRRLFPLVVKYGTTRMTTRISVMFVLSSGGKFHVSTIKHALVMTSFRSKTFIKGRFRSTGIFIWLSECPRVCLVVYADGWDHLCWLKGHA